MLVLLLTWLGTSRLVGADLIPQTLRHTDLPYISLSVKWIQLFLLFSYDLFRIKSTNHEAMRVLKDGTWWGLWKYTNRLDESAEIIYLAPWLIIYLKLNPCIALCIIRAPKIEVPLWILPAISTLGLLSLHFLVFFEFWVEQLRLLHIRNNLLYQAADLTL